MVNASIALKDVNNRDSVRKNKKPKSGQPFFCLVLRQAQLNLKAIPEYSHPVKAIADFGLRIAEKIRNPQSRSQKTARA